MDVIKRKPENLSGIITVLNTPFRNDETIDFEALKKNVENALEAGVKGFLVPAMASEVYKLSENERIEMVEATLDAAKEYVPVFAGAGEMDIQKSKNLIKQYIKLGCKYILFQIPFINEEQFIHHFNELASCGSEFIMLQDWDPTGSGIPDHLIYKLFAQVDAFRFLKIETTPAGVKYSRIKLLTGNQLHLSGGWAVTQMLEGLDRGVDAFMPTGMHWIYTEIVNLYHNGNRAKAESLFHEILPVLAFSNQHLDISIHFFKRLLFEQGIYPAKKVRNPSADFDLFHEKLAENHIRKIITIEDKIKIRRKTSK